MQRRVHAAAMPCVINHSTSNWYGLTCLSARGASTTHSHCAWYHQLAIPVKTFPATL